MTPHAEPSPDAGLSLLIVAGPGEKAGTITAAWKEQLDRLGRPYELWTSPSDRPGDAIREGLAATTYPLVGLVVPDFAYRPADIRLLLEAVREADLVLGVRPTQPRPPWLERVGRAGRWISRVVFGMDLGEPAPWFGWPAARRKLARRFWYGLRVQDAETGLRLWRRSSLDRWVVQSAGRFVLVEQVIKLNFMGGMIAEMPLGPPGRLPVAGPFADVADDERTVFRHPKFLPTTQKGPEETGSSGPPVDHAGSPA